MTKVHGEPVTVLIADDQALVRSGIAAVLGRSPAIRVIGEASTGDEAVRLVRELQPDVVLMDLRMPGMSGVEATEMISEDPGVDTRVIVLTTFDDDEELFGALGAGASGYLLKDGTVDELVDGIGTVAEGGAVLAPEVTERVMRGARGKPPGADRRDDGVLTPREREVLDLITRGASNAEISEALTVSPATTKTHIRHLLQKLTARDRAQLVVIAFERRLVDPILDGPGVAGP